MQPPPRSLSQPTRAPVPDKGTVALGLAAIAIAAASRTERMPPRLSTGSVVSLTWLGTTAIASTNATTASGSVSRKTDPHQYRSSSHPESRGPSDEIAPPRPDHRAIEWVRAAPVHKAVISASVVGYAIPADNPPKIRAAMSTSSLGA